MKAFIFDFDGVIVDSQKYWDEHAMELYRTIVPEWTAEDNYKMRAIGVYDIYEMLVKDYGLTQTREEFIALLDTFALDLYMKKSDLIDGIEGLIEHLNVLKIPLGISTASRTSWLTSALTRHRIDHHFIAMTTADDVKRGKPDPEVYLRTAEKLKVAPRDCVVLEDSEQGMAAAKAAGMYCIGLMTKEHVHRSENLSAADRIIAHPSELTLEVLKKL